jgi:hypothetical protein
MNLNDIDKINLRKCSEEKSLLRGRHIDILFAQEGYRRFRFCNQGLTMAVFPFHYFHRRSFPLVFGFGLADRLPLHIAGPIGAAAF